MLGGAKYAVLQMLETKLSRDISDITVKARFLVEEESKTSVKAILMYPGSESGRTIGFLLSYNSIFEDEVKSSPNNLFRYLGGMFSRGQLHLLPYRPQPSKGVRYPLSPAW